MSNYLEFHAFIVDPDIDTRNKLKQAAMNVHTFKKATPYNSLPDTLVRLRAGERADVVFISYRIGQDQVSHFIEQAKKTKYGQDCAYILVLKPQAQNNATVGETVLVGVDGFLFEPFSVDGIQESADIARRVKLENAAKRERTAITLVLTDVMENLDRVALGMANGIESQRAVDKMREACQNIHKLKAESLETYFEVAMEMFETAAPRPVTEYAGVSKRVRERMEAKLRAQLEEELNSE